MALYPNATMSEAFRDSAFRTRDRVVIRQGAVGGALAGLAAGLVMALVAMFWAAATGRGMAYPFELMAGMFYGTRAILGSGEVILTGFVIHFVTSAILGALFGLLIGARAPRTAALMAGLAFGLIVWVLAYFLVLPAINPLMADRMEDAPAVWLAFFLLFGAALCLTPWFSRAYAERRVPPLVE